MSNCTQLSRSVAASARYRNSGQLAGWAISAIAGIGMHKPGDHVAFPTTTRRPQEASP